jgi:hypothetical protein
MPIGVTGHLYGIGMDEPTLGIRTPWDGRAFGGLVPGRLLAFAVIVNPRRYFRIAAYDLICDMRTTRPRE